jgi:RND family efflux transporter MFP subunit
MRKLIKMTAVVLGAAGVAGCESPKPTVAQPKPPVVLVGTPITREVTEFEDFTGRTDAVYSVEVRARVTGYLDKVYFKDGDDVHEGDLLFEIDPRPYQADFDRTESTVAQGLAHLKRLEADNRRAQNLFKRQAIGQEEYDRITGDYSEAVAAVGIAKANRDLAKLSLGFTKVTAPISGRLSRRLVDPGNLVTQDQTSLTTIVSLDPMYVYFDIDERTLLRLRGLVKSGRLKTRHEAEVPLQGALADEEGFPHKGTINFSENRLDANTGTLRIRAVMENPKVEGRPNFRLLSPGLFMRVRLPIGAPYKATLVPEQALGTDQGRRFIYVVNDKNQAIYRPLDKVGPLEGGFRVIESGVSPGERIIVSGLQRVRRGEKVDPRPAEPPAKTSTVSTPAATGERRGAAEGAPADHVVASRRNDPAPAVPERSPRTDAAPASDTGPNTVRPVHQRQ